MGRDRIDLNADLGEGMGTDADLLAIVSSASIACGGHAGDAASMREIAGLARRHGVTVGAHPSYPDREGFGRRDMQLGPTELMDALRAQVGSLREVSEVAFMKPHGALYNRAARDPVVAEVVVRAAAETGLALLCPGGSEMWRIATEVGVAVFAEAFADRAYRPDGSLAPRSDPGSVIEEPGEVARRAVSLAVRGGVAATGGSWLAVPADSICIHGDTPGAVAAGRAVRAALEAAGLKVRAFRP